MSTQETVSDYLTSGGEVVVSLLTAVPTSNDPGTWQTPTWAGYMGTLAVPQVLNDLSPYAKLVLIRTLWRAGPGAYQIVAIGITRGDQFSFYDPLERTEAVIGGQDFIVENFLLMQNWVN